MYNSHLQLLKEKQVLLIENDEVTQMLLGYMLKKEGARVDIETKRDAILEHLKTNRTDLILLDTSLDSVNVFEFTRRMRDEMDIQIPIFGMSVTDLRGRGIYHGLDHVIRKPVQYSAFQDVLQKFGFSGN